MNKRYIWIYDAGCESYTSLSNSDTKFFDNENAAVEDVTRYIADDVGGTPEDEDVYIVEVGEVVGGNPKPTGYKLSYRTKVV